MSPREQPSSTTVRDCLFCRDATEHRLMPVPEEGARRRRRAVETQRLLEVCVRCGGGLPVPQTELAPDVPQMRSPVTPTGSGRMRSSECYWPTIWI